MVDDAQRRAILATRMIFTTLTSFLTSPHHHVEFTVVTAVHANLAALPFCQNIDPELSVRLPLLIIQLFDSGLGGFLDMSILAPACMLIGLSPHAAY
jgi:hypothetical protein